MVWLGVRAARDIWCAARLPRRLWASLTGWSLRERVNTSSLVIIVDSAPSLITAILKW